MADVRILPVTTEHFADAQRVLSTNSDGRSCQCQWWMLTNADYQRNTAHGRAEMLRAQMGAAVAPALIAFVGDDPAGWVRVGPRPAQVRLARTKEFGAATPPWDDGGVWAVSCFVIREQHRGRGLLAQLLDAAVDHARANGATVVEGYPLDPETARPPSDKLFRGVLSVFEKGGFEIVARPQPGRAIVARTL
ncbi:acetyltransferase (GNAT) family protein [Microbacterium sp. AG1240]|uniref:GNAT family N-acetyltransferase n=1 Tax=Microbacterium sp. AG1240 TaxID=2183992 RepID=UPI000EB460D7|nr:GNAT family N-acetyltransferase [Microbacterium sp. AG1240]RKT37067.1 acetyltransferase (GNAT) family protein [Microbacterium sp. AG1240]